MCCTTRGQIKSKGKSLIKKKERYAVPKRGQINLYTNYVIEKKPKMKMSPDRNQKEILCEYIKLLLQDQQFYIKEFPL